VKRYPHNFSDARFPCSHVYSPKEHNRVLWVKGTKPATNAQTKKEKKMKKTIRKEK
jgi:hypothetical protein